LYVEGATHIPLTFVALVVLRRLMSARLRHDREL
jgi:hypothetical protein